MSDIILSALGQRNGIVCVFTDDGFRHYVTGYKGANNPKLSECDSILRTDAELGLSIYRDIEGMDCLHKDYYRAIRHPSLGGPY